MPIVYITDINELVSLHQKTIEVSGGGTVGILSLNSLCAALDHIQNDDYYPTFEDKLTHLFYVANKSHSFQDGNKRIAITVGSIFLLKNGYINAAKEFLYRMEIISYHVAASNIDKELLHEIITSILNEADFSEELKLKIACAISQDGQENEEY
ncbi:MAG TPA: type II toxin-antitoxin system death-on-curing family toxin [Bacteroidales bacterium]|mgnify:CR=1 FL=1|jgi:death-on-curing protein|nr:type II toxin-antitoxin system death-on-curing family toxin [Bacteroidales bacterium]